MRSGEGRNAGIGRMGRGGRVVGGAGLWLAAALLAGCGAEAEQSGSVGDSGEAVDRQAPVILITGSTGGLGREVALEMGSMGAHVIVHGRSEERGREVVDLITEEGEGSAVFRAADLASLDEVRELADWVRGEYDRLDVLVNNAGIWLHPDDGRVLNDEGVEMHFQVNYLAHFLLTRELLDLLRASGTAESPSRVVHVSSVAQRPIDFDDPMMADGYSDGRGYAQSKLAQILHTFDLAVELEGEPVKVFALHPATMMDTDMVLSRGAQARASVDEGRDAVVNLIVSSGLESGQYFNGLNPARANEQAYDLEARERLRTLSQELVGQR